jgi:hypothetical protein
MARCAAGWLAGYALGLAWRPGHQGRRRAAGAPVCVGAGVLLWIRLDFVYEHELAVHDLRAAAAAALWQRRRAAASPGALRSAASAASCRP